MKNKIDKTEYLKINQAKYDYFHALTFWSIVISCIVETAYFVSDCQLFNRFAYETVVARFIVILPMIAYIIADKKIKDFRIMSLLAYIIVHINMWCTIWAIIYLPNKDFAREGFIIMHFMFIAIGFGTPRKYSLIAHPFVIINILVSNCFNHYGHLDMMMSLGLPIMIGIQALIYVCDKTYRDMYRVNNELEFGYNHDQLTLAYNRNKLADICISTSKLLDVDRAGILLIDIDFFKTVNDTYGHNNGDIVLKEIVKTIKRCIRKESDYVVRWGGEEFLVIIDGVDEDKTIYIAESIRNKVKMECKTVCDITVSIGATIYKLSESYESTVRRADRALYKSKSNGRDKVTFMGIV